MKIKPEHFEILKRNISEKYTEMLTHHKTDFETYLATHNDKRIAWDLCHNSGCTPFICDTLYKYLNDSHIETALKNILKELKK